VASNKQKDHALEVARKTTAINRRVARCFMLARNVNDIMSKYKSCFDATFGGLGYESVDICEKNDGDRLTVALSKSLPEAISIGWEHVHV
jgi:hypothetical protein